MSTYLKQLEGMEVGKREAVCKALLDTMYAIREQLGGLADNHPVFVKDLDEYNDPNNTDFLWSRLMCLKWLAEGAEIIDIRYMEDFKYIPAGSNGSDYMVTIINRYVFEELLLTLQKIDARLTGYDGYDKSIEEETAPNLAYYDTRTGRGIVNGNAVYLRGRNKRLFNAPFLAAPNSIDKNLLEGIAKANHKDDPLKYAMNDAFSAVRKACKVDKTVIYQRNGTGKLDARTFPLSFQFFQNTYGKTEIRPKRRPQ